MGHRRHLTYRDFGLWLHGAAASLVLVPFTMILQVPYRTPADLPLFTANAGSKSIIVSASGICHRENAKSAFACSWRRFQDCEFSRWSRSPSAQHKQSRARRLRGRIRSCSSYKSRSTRSASHPSSCSSVWSLLPAARANHSSQVGLSLHLLLLVTLFSRHRSSFRNLHPPFRALTTLASTFLLLAFALWVALIACVLEAYVCYCKRDVSEAIIDGSRVDITLGSAISVLHGATSVSVLGLLASLYLLACWDFMPERREVLARLKGVELESQTDGTTTTTPVGSPLKKKSKGKPKDLPMGQAIAAARNIFDEGPNPPQHPQATPHPEDRADDPFASDGRVKKVYVDGEGHVQRAMIAADLTESPTTSTLPSPKALKPEDHPWTAPVWATAAAAAGPSRPVKASVSRPVLSVIQTAPLIPTFAPTPTAPRRQRSLGPTGPHRRPGTSPRSSPPGKALPATFSPGERQPSLSARRGHSPPAPLPLAKPPRVLDRPRPLPKHQPNPARPDSVHAFPPARSPAVSVALEMVETPRSGLPNGVDVSPDVPQTTAPLRIERRER
jgi:hypothetical protein